MSAITDAELLAQLRHMYEALTTIPADDLATIEHLDFAPEFPCEFRGYERDHAADWFVYMTRCCPCKDRGAVCTEHLDAYLAGPSPRCPHCRTLYATPSESIRRIEPIGGKS